MIPLVNQKIESHQRVNAAGFATVNSKQDAMAGQMSCLVNMVAPLASFAHHVSQYEYNPNQFVGASLGPGYTNPFHTSTNQVPGPSVAARRQPTAPRVNGGAAPNRYEPAARYDSATMIYNEWHGIAPHSGPEGGIVSLERVHKTKWRSRWDQGVKKRFSRMKYIVGKADSLNNNIENVTIQGVLAVLDQVFVNHDKSLSKVEAYMKTSQQEIVQKIQMRNFTAV